MKPLPQTTWLSLTSLSVLVLATGGFLTGCQTSAPLPASVPGPVPEEIRVQVTPGFTNNIALVQAIRGSGTAEVWNGRWEPLEKGMRLSPGANVRTVGDTTVDLFLRQNGPVVRLTPNTFLVIEQLEYKGAPGQEIIHTRLNVKQGRILGATKKLDPESVYEVKTPKGLVGVRDGYDVDKSGKVQVK